MAFRYTLLGIRGGSDILTRRMYVRRTGELAALSGWRATLSTCMELGDVLAPVAAGIVDRLSSFVSWLLVSLIGRGLGLIYRGVRQSMAGGGKGGAGQDDAQRTAKRPLPASAAAAALDSDEEVFFGFAGA